MTVRLRESPMGEPDGLRHEPRDPFHRIGILHGSRHAVVSGGARTLADSRAPILLFEPPLPVRDYPPPEVTGRIAFFNQRVDITVHGERLERPGTPWSRR